MMVTSDWQIGDRIQNRWEVHKIMRGGMGVVYVVYDHELHEPFAVKTVRSRILAFDQHLSERFKQEALVWISLDRHQNIVQASHVEAVAGRPLLFLEYISGGDLSRWIGTQRLTRNLRQALHFAIQLCDGMIYLISKGDVFRRQVVNLTKFPSVDIEPANLRWSAFAASFIVGSEIFSLLVRYVRKLADYVSDREGTSVQSSDNEGAPEREPSQGWNMIHVLTPFTTGFFVNLVYEKVLQVIHTQIS
jgi:serine/threonine protein kinase